jgi:hypothetical protein
LSRWRSATDEFNLEDERLRCADSRDKSAIGKAFDLAALCHRQVTDIRDANEKSASKRALMVRL